MSCDAWHEALIAFLDAEIDPGERDRLEGHLGSCERCRADLAELKATSAVLRRWETMDPPTELVFVDRQRRGIRWRLSDWGRSVLVPAALGAAAAAAVSMIVIGQRTPDAGIEALAAEMSLLRERVAQAEARTREVPAVQARRESPEPSPVTASSSGEPVAVADLAPETREWFLKAVGKVVQDSESRQDVKLVLTADQLARSLALQRRDDLSLFDRRLRDAQAETFQALLSTHERLDRLAPEGQSLDRGRLEPR